MGIFQQFPYSNFHEFNLDQIIKIMREMQNEWAATKTEWASYKDFIDNYFANLDVSEEVLAAIRTLARTGELNTVIDPVIVSETDEWLSEHITITQGSTVIDDTLSIAGAAADAKATGDAIANTKKDLTDEITAIYNDKNEIPIDWTDGGYIDRTSGQVVADGNWKYSDYIDVSNITNGFFFIRTAGGDSSVNSYNMMYDASRNIIQPFGFNRIDDYDIVPIYVDTKFVRLSCRKTENVKMFEDMDKVDVPFFRDNPTTTRLTTDFIEIDEAKYILETIAGISIAVYSSDYTSIATTAYSASREWYRSNNAKYVKLFMNFSNYSYENIKAVKWDPKKEYNEIPYFRLMSFNVGLWYDGRTKLPVEQIAERAIEWHRFIGDINPDVFGMLEAPSTIDTSNSYYNYRLYNFKLPFRFASGSGNTQHNIACKNGWLNAEEKAFSSGSGRPCLKFNYEIAGITVVVYLVHLSVEANTTGIRQTDLAQIKTWLEQDDYVIVMGDFNTFDMSELDIFNDYNIANGGDFGSFITWPNVSESWPNGCIDNIITTSNISIQNVIVPDVTLSDHKPIIADLSLYY